MLLRIMTILLTLLSTFAYSQSNQQRLNSIQELKHFAFGSCNYHHGHQYFWKDLAQKKPQLWLWGGDNVYADWNKSTDDIRASYQKMNEHPDYQQFKEQVPIIGTWDDHDYGHDEADGWFGAKKESQRLFLDFMEEAEDSPRRAQEGIYTSYSFGQGHKKVKFIMLDNRYFKNMEPDAAMLGKVQWEWLEQELKNSDASIHFIVSGLSVLSPVMPYTEQWADYGWEYERLMNLMDKYKPKGLVFLTGDKHFASIWKSNGHLEFMSSGMTHTAPRMTWWYLSRRYPITFFGINYGAIDIDWASKVPRITTAIKNWSGHDVFSKNFAWENGSWKEQWSFQLGADQYIEQDIKVNERAP